MDAENIDETPEDKALEELAMLITEAFREAAYGVETPVPEGRGGAWGEAYDKALNVLGVVSEKGAVAALAALNMNLSPEDVYGIRPVRCPKCGSSDVEIQPDRLRCRSCTAHFSREVSYHSHHPDDAPPQD